MGTLVVGSTDAREPNDWKLLGACERNALELDVV